MKKFLLLASLAGLGILASRSQGAVVITTSSLTYTQSFDSLANSGTSVAWTNDTTIAGWSLFNQVAGGTALTNYDAGTGSSNSGKFFSFGASGSAERALGGQGSGGAYFGSPSNGNVAGWIAVAFTNSAGQTLTGLTLSYDGEQWRDGGATTPVAQTMVLEYGFGSTFTSVSSWTAPGGNWNFTSPVYTNTGSGAAVVGNTAGLVAGRGGSLTGLNWTVGSTLWVRWVEKNDAGNDHGLAIDGFSFTAVPEPSVSLLGLASLGLFVRRRR